MSVVNRSNHLSESRFIVCGDIKGQIHALFERLVRIMHYTGSIDAVFCIGDFIGEDITEFEMCRDGRLSCPVPVFFIGPSNSELGPLYPSSNGAVIATNLFYLGRRGVVTTDQGVCIAYCSGLESAIDDDDDESSEQCKAETAPNKPTDLGGDPGFFIQSSDIEYIERALNSISNSSSTKPVDVLLTSAIPAGYDRFPNADSCSFDDGKKSPIVTQLALKLKPRYHFCDGSGTYFCSPPYRNSSNNNADQQQFPTRMIALANPHSVPQTKGVYAFQIVPTALLPQNVNLDLADSVDCPYPKDIIPSKTEQSLAAADTSDNSEQTTDASNATISQQSSATVSPNPVNQLQYFVDLHPQRTILATHGATVIPALTPQPQLCHHPQAFALTAPGILTTMPTTAFGSIGPYGSAVTVPNTFVTAFPTGPAPTLTTNQYVIDQLSPYVVTAASSNPQHLLQVSSVPCRQPYYRLSGEMKSSFSFERSSSCDVHSSACWFCMGDSKHEDHLVISVGETTYLSLSKGGLVDDHVMIVPFDHIASTRLCGQDILDDIERYKIALIEFFEKERNCVPVFFERSFKTVHLQIQCIPIPKSKEDIIEEVFLQYLDQLEADFEYLDRKTHLAQVIDETISFFVVDLPFGKRILVRSGENNIHLQFGRIVLASKRLLNISARAFDWKLCLQSKDQEERIVKEFFRAFASYDPALRNGDNRSINANITANITQPTPQSPQPQQQLHQLQQSKHSQDPQQPQQQQSHHLKQSKQSQDHQQPLQQQSHQPKQSKQSQDLQQPLQQQSHQPKQWKQSQDHQQSQRPHQSKSRNKTTHQA